MVAKDVDKELKEVVWNHPDSRSSVRIREKNYAHFYKKNNQYCCVEAAD